jgi:catalase-peroxidase
VPEVDHELVEDSDVEVLKQSLLDSGLSLSQLVSTAWASAASFRQTDRRGGAWSGVGVASPGLQIQPTRR